MAGVSSSLRVHELIFVNEKNKDVLGSITGNLESAELGFEKHFV